MLIAMIQRFSGPVKVGLRPRVAKSGCSGRNFPLRASLLCNCPRHRSRPSRFPGARERRLIGSTRNSSPGSWHSDRKPGENCQMEIVVFSEL